MLNNVPIVINRMVRNVVINHPNSANVVCIRKVVAVPSDETLVAGLPTIGGLGVISSYDESDITWTPLGNGFALRADKFEPSLMMDREDANNGEGDEFRYLIEPETPGAFTLQKDDAFYIIIGPVRLAYEIINIETTSNIPPFTLRYICNRRNDIDTTI